MPHTFEILVLPTFSCLIVTKTYPTVILKIMD